MTESGYDSRKGEEDVSQILDILHPFSTTVLKRDCWSLQKTSELRSDTVFFKGYECLYCPGTMVVCNRLEEIIRGLVIQHLGKQS